MTFKGFSTIRRTCRLALAALLVLATIIPTLTTPAMASNDRSLYLYYTHTRETINIVYKRDGRYIAEALRTLNVFLRDWRRNEPAQMDPALFDLLWEVYRQTGASQPIHIVSAYRAPATNAMLRSSSSGVAENSQHMQGRAIDFFIPGVPISRIRELGMVMQVGGVGYYPNSNSPFVHLDTASVRAWPRMTTAQLQNLFPDGRTLHIGSDGTVLSQEGRRIAEAEWIQCHRVPCSAGSIGGDTMVADAPRRRTLMDLFFGNDDSEAAEDMADTQAVAVAAAPAPAPAPVQAAPAPAPVAAAPATVVAVAPTVIEPPLPPARPTTLVALADAADAAPPVIPFQVIDSPDEVVVAAVEAPVPPARPAGLPTTLVAEAPIVAAAAGLPVAETAAQAIAGLDGLPPNRPEFEPGAVIAAYAQPGQSLVIDAETITAALPSAPTVIPAVGQDLPLPAALQGLRAGNSDPGAGLEAFAALFEGPIDYASGDAPHLDPALSNAMATLAIAEGELYAPDMDASPALVSATSPISGPGFGAMAMPDAAGDATALLAATPAAYGDVPRFGGAGDTIWVRLE